MQGRHNLYFTLYMHGCINFYRTPPQVVHPWSNNMRTFAAKTPDGLPEYFVGLPVTQIQFMSGIFPTLRFELFTARALNFRLSRLSAPRIQRRVCFVLKPWLVGYFLCLNCAEVDFCKSAIHECKFTMRHATWLVEHLAIPRTPGWLKVYLKAQLVYQVKRKTDTANVSLTIQPTSSGRKNKSDTPSANQASSGVMP